MLLTPTKLLTAEEFWQVAHLPENDTKRLELEDGVIIEMASSSPLNTITASRLIYFLNAFVMPRQLGYVTGADGGFKLATHKVRQPDVAFISKQRVPKIPKTFEITPDLAIEIVSPNEDIFKKAYEYFQAGTRLVWAVYAQEKTVHVMRLDDDGGLRSFPHTMDDVLSGEDVLMDFRLPVRDIFVE
jgi:Uma2 family endonuclease